jgi:hypothetical protein
MLGATHLIAGAAVYRLVRNKPLGLAAALVSHFALDRVPHYELSLNWNILLGALTGLLLLGAVWKWKDPWLAVAGFLGLYPDINWLLGLNDTFDAFHSWIHYQSTSLTIGVMAAMEIAAYMIGVYFLYKRLSRKGAS